MDADLLRKLAKEGTDDRRKKEVKSPLILLVVLSVVLFITYFSHLGLLTIRTRVIATECTRLLKRVML